MGLQIDGFVDIETESWDRYVLGACMWSDGDYLETRDEDELWSALLDRGGTIWAWNGGKYDALAFAHWASAREIPFSAQRAGSRVTTLECGALKIRDAVALIPMRLERAAELVGWEKLEFPYERIRHDMPLAELRLLADYLRRDVELGLAILRWLANWAERHGFTLAGTVGASAWATAQKRLGLPDARWELLSHYRLAARAKYGGRVQVLRPVASSGIRDDMNSAYPAALQKTPLPVGEPSVVSGDRAARCYAAGLEGIYQATVRVPVDAFLPPLPIKVGLRVAYPIGRVRGTWTGLELRAALEHGVTIERLGTSLVWPDAQPILRPIVETIWQLRAAAGKRSAEGELCKWWANSFTGKLGQTPESYQVVANPDGDAPVACPGIHGPCRGPCKGGKAPPCKRWRLLGGNIWARPVWRLASCAHVHWSDYLLAACRVEWLAHAVADGQNGSTLVYGDTDSNFATTPRAHRMGAELGEWDREGEFREWRAIAPKAYSYLDPATGRRKVRCKGLPDVDADAFERFARGETVRADRGVYSLVVAARMGSSLFRRKTIERTNRSDGFRFGDRVLRGDGLTYPQTVDSLWRDARR